MQPQRQSGNTDWLEGRNSLLYWLGCIRFSSASRLDGRGGLAVEQLQFDCRHQLLHAWTMGLLRESDHGQSGGREIFSRSTEVFAPIWREQPRRTRKQSVVAIAALSRSSTHLGK